MDVLNKGRVQQLRNTSRHNLPAPRSGFVGREQEMMEVWRELETTRLLTLTGAGGSGKTRLAVELARDLVDTYAAGVWLVELAPPAETLMEAIRYRLVPQEKAVLEPYRSSVRSRLGKAAWEEAVAEGGLWDWIAP